MVAVVDEVTALVETVKSAVLVPAATTTLPGTAADALLLVNATAMPPAGAAPFKVTVPVDELPPTTVAGFTEREASPTGCPADRGITTVELAAIATLSWTWPP